MSVKPMFFCFHVQNTENRDSKAQTLKYDNNILGVEI